MEKKIILLILAPFLISWHWFEPVAKKNGKGIESYYKNKFNNALDYFLSAKGIDPSSATLKNNTALTLYNLKKYKEALKEFSGIDLSKTKKYASKIYYNIGNSNFRINKLKEALENYKKSLILDPEDLNTKKNYELTKKKLEDQKKGGGRSKKNKKSSTGQDKKNNENKYKNIFNYLNRKEKEKIKKKKIKTSKKKNDKDW